MALYRVNKPRNPQANFHVKKNDEVVVLTGTQQGKRGKVLEVLRDRSRVIVEGVETQGQLELIRECGGDEIQGYLMGRPTADPAGQLAASLRAANNVDESDETGRETAAQFLAR